MGYLDEEMMARERKELELLEKQSGKGDVQEDLMALKLNEETTNLVKEQLNLEAELFTIENLLRGNYLKKGKWVAPSDTEQIILTEHGVQLIMNTIIFYINKNTLLSNYEEETINKKMEDFATALADVIFMEYEKVFRYPTFEECKEVLEARIQRKTELRKFAYQIIGKKADEKEIKQGILQEIEDRVESEITKIKEQIIKNKPGIAEKSPPLWRQLTNLSRGTSPSPAMQKSAPVFSSASFGICVTICPPTTTGISGRTVLVFPTKSKTTGR